MWQIYSKSIKKNTNTRNALTLKNIGKGHKNKQYMDKDI